MSDYAKRPEVTVSTMVSRLSALPVRILFSLDSLVCRENDTSNRGKRMIRLLSFVRSTSNSPRTQDLALSLSRALRFLEKKIRKIHLSRYVSLIFYVYESWRAEMVL